MKELKIRIQSDKGTILLTGEVSSTNIAMDIFKSIIESLNANLFTEVFTSIIDKGDK